MILNMAVQFCPNSWPTVMIASEVTLMVLANAQAKGLSCLWLWTVTASTPAGETASMHYKKLTLLLQSLLNMRVF